MEKKEIIHPDKADKNFSTGAYSSRVVAAGWLYVSGQGPINFKTSKFELGEMRMKHILLCTIFSGYVKMQDVHWKIL